MAMVFGELRGSNRWNGGKRILAAFAAAAVTCFVLHGCGSTRINGLTPREFGEEALFKAFITMFQGMMNLPAEREAEKRTRAVVQIANLQASIGEDYTLSQERIVAFETAFQPLLDDIVKEIRATQQRAGDAELNRLGPACDMKLRVENSRRVDAYARRNGVTCETFITSALLVESSRRLIARRRLTGRFGEIPDDGDSDTYRPTSDEEYYTARYRVAIEMTEMLRFVIGHEAVHNWLDQKGKSVRESEIEADAWGIALSGATSEVLKYRALSARSSRSVTSDYQRSLIEARSGPELFLYLYQGDGIFSLDSARQGFDERLAFGLKKHKEVSTTYAASLSRGDVRSFKWWQAIQGFDFQIGDPDAKDCAPGSLGVSCRSK